jgi:dTDP-glucose pyrophosphorylase
VTVSKAIVLARGLGTRMRAEAGSTPLAPDQADMAATGLKAMMPVGRPFLDHVLANLADAGLDDICVVIGPEHGVVRDYYARLPRTRVHLTFAEQPTPRGTADAVYAARRFAVDEGFVVVNGDNLYPVSACRALRSADGPALVGFTRAGLLKDGLIAPERLASFAVIDADGGWLRRIIEKPDARWLAAEGAGLLVSMNCWRFDSEIFDVIPSLPLSPRGELELPSAAQALVDRGVRFRVLPSDEGVLDLSRRSDVIALEQRLAGREVQL